MTSIIQCLRGISHFDNYFHTVNTAHIPQSICLAFINLLCSFSQHTQDAHFSIFYSAFISKYSKATFNSSTCSLDFLILILYELDLYLPDDLITTLFEGRINRKYDFTFYNYEHTEKFKFLKFDIPDIYEIDLLTLSSRYLNTTVYTTYNEIYIKPGTLSSEVKRWPSVLILYLNRFHNSKSMISTAVKISEELIFTEGPRYSLVSICSHIQNAEFGHTYSIVQKQNQWKVYDDEHVEPIAFSGIAATRVCILFYQRE